LSSEELIAQNREFGRLQTQEGIDFSKLGLIAKKSWWIILLILILGSSTGYLTVRYTKPLYESTAVIKLDFKSEASNLGLVENSGINSSFNDISGEIELLRSKLFFSKLIEELDYPVAYYAYGTYLVDERFRNSPFEVSFRVKNSAFFDRAIDVQLLNDREFELSYEGSNGKFKERFSFGTDISTADLNLKIDKTEDFSLEILGRYFFRINSEEQLIRYFENSLNVLPENLNAKTIRISLTDFNKYKAREFISLLTRMYLQYSKASKNQVTEQKLVFLDSLIASTDDNIKNYEDYFENFTIENKTVNLQSDLSRTINLLAALDSQQFRFKNQLGNVLLIQEKIGQEVPLLINPFIIETLPQFMQDAVTDYLSISEKRQLKSVVYNENTRAIREIDEQLEIARGQVKEVVDQYRTVLEEQLGDNRRRMSVIEGSFVQLPSMGTEYSKNRRLYQELEGRLGELRRSKMDLELTRAGTVSDFIILASASLPLSPIKPQKLLVYGGSVVLSIFLSILFIVLRYLIHTEITSVKELENLTTVPILGTIPQYSKEKLNLTKLVIDQHSKSAISESLRTIRTNMEFVNPMDKTNLLTITSTVSGEGKTFIAVNLGAIIASSNKRVCIVDLDMRKPKVHLAFGHEASPKGVSTILSKRDKLIDCVKDSGVEKLSYITAGPTPPNPSELMMGSEFDNMLEQLKKEFDLVILDTPPIGMVTDGVLAMKKSDLQLYVVKADYSKRKYIKTINDLQRINRFPHLVILLNAAKSATNGYGYGYGYGYYEEDKGGKKGFFGMF
jgi:tyrosine-protein kinase Etk/Wzc